MKQAFGVLELLVVVVIIIIIYFTCFHSPYGRKDPFNDKARINSQQEIIDDKIQEIETTKALKKQIEQNLNEGKE